MRIEIDVENPSHPAIEQPQDAERNVVQITEPARVVGATVMRAASRRGAPLPTPLARREDSPLKP
jgi:hypothetical protein